ncbi:hypothetical protein N0V90_009366 [Kalmusia sp. IMI 367209]|nr:hypothetical protein N0V90_009366 [Kalmusia sp. IMI 367209]
MKSLSCISLSKTSEDSIERHRIAMKDRDGTSAAGPGYKSSKLQTLVEVLRCELGRSGRSSTSNSGFEPTKQWTPPYYAVYHKREAALSHFLRAGQTPDGSEATQPMLCIAVVAGHIEIVKILCEAGANVNAQCTHSGETPLHLAVKAGRDDILDLLLRYKPDLDIKTLYTQETPLHYAAAKVGNTDAALALLKHKASYEALNNKGFTPAEVSLQIKDIKTAVLIIRATRSKPHKLIKEKQLLLKRVETPRDPSLDTDLVAQILEVACPADSTSLVEGIKTLDTAVVRLILERGADPNRATSSGLYPMFAAFNACSAPVVQALIEHGADVTLRNPHGPNVLQAALASPLSKDKESITKVFELLLSRGAAVHTAYSDGSTLLHHAVRPGLGLVKIAQQLIQHGVNINTQDTLGNTALHVAATSPPCVTLLLKHGADPNLVNNKGFAPLLYAIKSATNGSELDLQHLLKASDVRQVDSTKKNALHLAAQNGLNKIVKLLLDAGVDSASTDSKNRTPLLLAVLHHQWAIVPLLAAQPGINSWDENGLTALHYIAMSNPKAPSTWKHIATAAAPFCEKGVSRSMRDQSGSTPLIQAVKSLPEDGLPVIEALLFQKGAARSNCVAHEDHQERNALYYAAISGKLAFIEALLKHGTPFSLSEWRLKRGPLKPNSAVNKRILKLFAEHEWLRRIASLRRQPTAVSEDSLLPKVLPIRDLNDMLSMGLDPNDLPKTKPAGSLLWTILDHSTPTSTFSSQYFHDALKLASAFGADPNAMSTRRSQRISKIPNSQQTPLRVHPFTYIVEQFPQVNFDIIKLLLDSGATLSTSSPLYDGRYPLHSAVRSNRLDIVEEIISREVNVNCTDVKKRTPIFIAADSGSLEILEVLLRSRARIDAQDSEGNTPLHIASAAGSVQIVSCLLRSGSNARSGNHKGLTPLLCIPDKLPDEEKQNIVIMLKKAERMGRQQAPLRAVEPKKPEEIKRPEVEKAAVNEGRTGLKKQRSISTQPINLSTTSYSPVTQQPPAARPAMTRLTSPTVTAPDAPAPLRLSKQVLSIRYTPPPPAPPPKSIQRNIPPPKPSPNITKPPQTPRVDSGLDLCKSNKEKPLPVLERKRASFDQLGEFPTETDELASWLNVSRMLDRL